MIFVTTILSSNEWMKLSQRSAQQWPGQELSRGEVLRRFSLVGADTLPQIPAEQRAELAKEFRESLDPEHPQFKGSLPVKT